MTNEIFWLNQPSMLLNKNYILNFLPSKSQSLDANMNAITRIITLLALIVFIMTKQRNIIIVWFVMLIIIIIYQRRNTDIETKNKIRHLKEGFNNVREDVLNQSNNINSNNSNANNSNSNNNANNNANKKNGKKENFEVIVQNIENTQSNINKILQNNFTMPTKENPMMNVMLPEINDNPNRKPAGPSFNKSVEKEIDNSVISNLDKRLFKNLGDNIAHQQSMRNFYTMPNTQIPNDQKAFAEFCYGSMLSCKEGDEFQCEKKNYRHINM
jgi:hypothetical protein